MPLHRTAHAPREGQEVLLNDPRPNSELLLCFGTIQDSNLSDCLLFDATLVPADKCVGPVLGSFDSVMTAKPTVLISGMY
jgi:hypothetical protein